MPKQTTTLSNFSAGELSPKLRGRYDLQFYPNGCEKLKNFIAETQGPARYRNGFRYVNNTLGNKTAVLIPFEFNAEQAYVLEFTDEKMRIYKDGGVVVEDSLNISGITKANPGVVTIALPAALAISGATKASQCVLTIVGNDLQASDSITISSVSGMTQLNGNTYSVVSVVGNAVTINVNSSGFTTYTSGGSAQRNNRHRYSDGDEIFISEVEGMDDINYHGPYTVANKTNSGFELSGFDTSGYDTYTSGGITEKIATITHPYAEEDLELLNYAQTADTMFIVHTSYEPRKLTRNSHSSWTFATYSRTSDPFGSAGNYPGAVAFYEQRIVFGGSDNDPQKLWFSKSDNYSDMTVGTNSDSGMTYTIASEKASVIRWLAPTEKQLVAGTTNGTFKIVGSATDSSVAITPTNISIRPSGSFGVATNPPVRNDDQLVFIQRGKKTVRSYEFDVLQDGFVNVDRTLLADHICDGNAKNLALQTGRPDIIWGSLEDGTLIGLTYKVKEQVSGWHRHTTGPSDRDSFEWVCRLPQESGQDQIWAVVKRTINGVTKRFVEYMEDQTIFPQKDDYYTGEENKDSDTEAFLRAMFEAQKLSFHLDAGGTFNSQQDGTTITPDATSGDDVEFTAGSAIFSSDDVGREIWSKYTTGRAVILEVNSSTSVQCKIKVDFSSTEAIAAGEWYFTTNKVKAIDYLEGETVSIITDGGVHPDKVVSNGEIILDYQASVIHFGYKYEGFLKTMRLGVQGAAGSSESKPMGVNKLAVLFYTSLGAYYGTDLYSLEKMQFRTTRDKMNRPAPLFSGFIDLQVSGDWDTNKYAYILQERSLPCIVQMIVPYITVNET